LPIGLKTRQPTLLSNGTTELDSSSADDVLGAPTNHQIEVLAVQQTASQHNPTDHAVLTVVSGGTTQIAGSECLYCTI
jgi:hypothetical protein